MPNGAGVKTAEQGRCSKRVRHKCTNLLHLLDSIVSVCYCPNGNGKAMHRSSSQQLGLYLLVEQM